MCSMISSEAALEPDHISAYNLTFEEGTAFFTEMKRGRIEQLPNDDQAAMYQLVREGMPRQGYAMYEISNYARPGHEARHNLTYWRGESYLGMGAGAHSFARENGRTAMVEREDAGAVQRRRARAPRGGGRRNFDEAAAQGSSSS